MTVSTNETKIAIKRCAVCKIDLKGRFVFVDEQVESIFNQSLEELFGKPMASYLDPAGQRLVKNLLLKYNRYETNYESCQVNLLNPDGSILPATLIFSLCFAAGNPVNYQILIDTELPSEATDDSEAGAGAIALFEALTELDSFDSLGDLTPALSQYLREPRVAFYKLGRDNLTRMPSDLATPVEIVKTSDLHLELALSGGCYSPDDPKAVSHAIELVGEAPDEFVCAFTSSESSYLMRVIIDKELSDIKINEIIKRINQVSKFITRTLKITTPVAVPVISKIPKNNLIASSLDAADLIDALAITINAKGEVVEHNLKASQLFHSELKQLKFTELFEKNLHFIEKDDKSKFDFYIDQAFKSADLPRFEAAVTIPGNILASLSLMRADSSDQKSDLLMIVKPVANVVDIKSARGIIDMAKLSLVEIQSLCRVANDYSSQLSHEYFSHLDGDGSFVLTCLSSCLDKALLSLSRYKEMFDITSAERSIVTTDLNVLMNELSGTIKDNIAAVSINISHTDLPKIQTDKLLLRSILEILFSEILHDWSAEEIEISVDAINSADNTALVIQLPTECSKQALKRLQNISQYAGKKIRDENVTHALTRLTVDHLLGSLDAVLEIDTQNQIIKINLHQHYRTHLTN